MDDLSTIAARYEAAAEPAWLWDGERRRVLWANAPAVVLFGAPSLFALTERMFSLDAPEARAVMRVGEGIDATLAPTGTPVSAVLNVSALHLPHARIARLVIVTEIKPATDVDPALMRRAALFDSAQAALVLCRTDGFVIDANAAAAAVNGMRVGHLSDLIGDLDARRLLSLALAQRHASIDTEHRGRALHASAQVFIDPADGSAGVLVRIEDVTARRDLETLLRARTEAAAAAPVPEPAPAPPSPDPFADDRRRMWHALRDAQSAREIAERKSAAKSDFIAKLSHEMRNPLNAIIGFAEIMQQRFFGPLGDRHYETYADDIRASADHLLSLVDDLLDLARIESGRLKLAFEPIEIGPMIEDCVRLLRPAAAGYNVTLVAEVMPLRPIVADARSLKQVLINLISNALKFTGSGGEVRVMAGAEPTGAVVVAVADTGVGMSAPEMQLALEPFGQVEGEHQKDRKGSGLGLPLAKALAEANQCQFEIVSEKEKGTLVRLVFPATRVAAE